MWKYKVMIRLIIIFGMFLVVTNSHAENKTDIQVPIKNTEQTKNLDLSIPEKDLEYEDKKPNQAYVETKEEEAKRKKCADMSRRIDALKGKFRPSKRSALINQHRAECQGRGEWQKAAPAWQSSP